MNKTIEELVDELDNIVFPSKESDGIEHVDMSHADFFQWFRTALTKAYEAGQVVGQIEMGKWVLYTNTGGRSGIHSKIDAIAESLKSKTDE